MVVNVSGVYPGLYVYPVSSLASLGTIVQGLLASVDFLLGNAILTNLRLFAHPVASDADVTFVGSTISFTADAGVPVTLDAGPGSAPEIVQQGQTALAFSSGGVDYVVTNGPLAGAVSLDASLIALAASADAGAASAVDGLRRAVERAGGGGLLVVPSGDLGDGGYQQPCFVTGTLILTPDGEVPVEHLRVGGLVTLATGIDAEIRWIGNRRVIDTADRPVRVRAGALKRDVPRRDLVVSPDHALFIDGILVPAGLLVNGGSIVREPEGAVTYHHVELDAHGVLVAEGAPAESYLDTGNRRQFTNCSLRYDPIDTARFDPCAEVLFGGPRLDAIRAKLSVYA